MSDLQMIKSIIEDRAKNSDFSEREEAIEVIEAIAEEYNIKITI